MVRCNVAQFVVLTKYPRYGYNKDTPMKVECDITV
jgi:hypothetical protein